jgi:hypothetical protein
MADQTLIGRITPRLRRIVVPVRSGRRAQIVRRTGQAVQARPAQRDQHVARQQRAQQQVSKCSKHENLIERAPAGFHVILNKFIRGVKTWRLAEPQNQKSVGLSSKTSL